MSFRNRDFDLNCPSESFPSYKPFAGSKLIPNVNETNRNRTQSSSSGSHRPFDHDDLTNLKSASRSFSEPPEDRAKSETNSSSQAQVVRHIPIFVEDRNEVILNRGGSQPDKIFGEEKINFPGTETNMARFKNKMGFDNIKESSSSSYSFESTRTKIKIGNSMSDNVPRPSPNFEKHTQKFQHQMQKPYPQSPQRFNTPAEMNRSSQSNQPQFSQQPQSQPQPQPQNKPKTPEEKISAVLKNVSNLNMQVVNFNGKKGDKTYLFLDEMFTRNLLLLDDIDSEGRESVRKFRKEAIEIVQRSISSLEKKAESNQSADKNEVSKVQLSLEEQIKKIEDILNRIGEKSKSGLAENAKSETGDRSGDECENAETRAVLVTKQPNVDEAIDVATTIPVENRAVLVNDPNPQPSSSEQSTMPETQETPTH